MGPTAANVEARQPLVEREAEGVLPQLLGRTFGDAKCIPCRIGTISCGIVVPGRTHYPEDIIEVIAPMALRRKLGVEDSDSVSVEVGP